MFRNAGLRRPPQSPYRFKIRAWRESHSRSE